MRPQKEIWEEETLTGCLQVADPKWSLHLHCNQPLTLHRQGTHQHQWCLLSL